MKYYIISQRNNLYIENDKIRHNEKEIEYEGIIENAVENKKIEIYRGFLSKYFENTIVLTGAGSSYGIGKTCLLPIMICCLSKWQMNVDLL